jgi:alpha-amylase
MAFDFSTKGLLQVGVQGELWRLRDAAGEGGQHDRVAAGEGRHVRRQPDLKTKQKMFVDNHDTGSTQSHWPFPLDKVMLGYAYIRSHQSPTQGSPAS